MATLADIASLTMFHIVVVNKPASVLLILADRGDICLRILTTSFYTTVHLDGTFSILTRTEI